MLLRPGLIKQGASGPAIQGARFNGTDNYVNWSATNVFGAASAKFMAAGILRLPKNPPSAADFPNADAAFWAAVSGGIRTQLAFDSTGTVLALTLRTNGIIAYNGLTTGAHTLNLANDRGKDIAYLIEVKLNGASAPTATFRIKIGTAAVIEWSAPTASAGTHDTTSTYNGLNIGAGYNGSTLFAPYMSGPQWITTDQSPVADGTITATNMWQDFFGVGSDANGATASPQWTGGNGAFTGAQTSHSYTQPAFMVDWIDLVNNGSTGSTGTENGTTPTYGNFASLT